MEKKYFLVNKGKGPLSLPNPLGGMFIVGENTQKQLTEEQVKYYNKSAFRGLPFEIKQLENLNEVSRAEAAAKAKKSAAVAKVAELKVVFDAADEKMQNIVKEIEEKKAVFESAADGEKKGITKEIDKLEKEMKKVEKDVENAKEKYEAALAELEK